MNLASVTIPASVTFIGRGVFKNCRNLTEVTYTGTLSQWKKISKNNSFENIFPSTIKLKCTDGEAKLSA